MPFVVTDDFAHSRPEAEELVAQLQRAHADGPDTVAEVAREYGLEPMSGARNNRVFRWEAAPGGPLCVKAYKVDDRRRHEREWNALTLLAGYRVPAVPRPAWCADDPVLPIIAMTMVPGTPIAELVDPAPALAALPELGRRLHRTPLAVFRSTERIDSADHYVHRINRIWAEQLRSHPQDAETAEMRDLLSQWRRSDDERVTCEWAPRILSRGDSNLLNWLWDGENIHVVDFEFTGHADAVFDAADLVEHISARPIDDAALAEVAAGLGITAADRRRYLAARRTCALRWLAVLWKQREQRRDEFDRQRVRMHALLDQR